MSKSDQKREVFEQPYPVQVQPIPEELGGGFIAFLPDFGHTACSATGDTPEEALDFLKEVKEEVIGHYLERGKRIPEATVYPFGEERLQQVPFRIPKSMHRRLKLQAARTGWSLNALLTNIVSDYLAGRTAADMVAKAIEECVSSLAGGERVRESADLSSQRATGWGEHGLHAIGEPELNRPIRLCRPESEVDGGATWPASVSEATDYVLEPTLQVV